MAVWHLERHSVQQARKYFGHLVTLRHDDADVWLCLSVYCAMTEEFDECNTASTRATVLIKEGGDDVRVKVCNALMAERRKDFSLALEMHSQCLTECGTSISREQGITDDDTRAADNTHEAAICADQPMSFIRELKGEVMLLIAILRKETRAYDLAMAVWHLERHSFQQARKYFGHLATLGHDDADVWLCLSVYCAITEEFDECNTALTRATVLIKKCCDDVRVKFCNALMPEGRKDFSLALKIYTKDNYNYCSNYNKMNDNQINNNKKKNDDNHNINDDDDDKNNRNSDNRNDIYDDDVIDNTNDNHCGNDKNEISDNDDNKIKNANNDNHNSNNDGQNNSNSKSYNKNNTNDDDIIYNTNDNNNYRSNNDNEIPIQIFIRSVSGCTFITVVSPADFIANIKERIYKVDGTPPLLYLPFPTVSLEYPTTIECHHLLYHHALLPPPSCLLCHPRPLFPPSPLHYLLPAMLLHTTGHTAPQAAPQAAPFLVHLRRPSTRPPSWLFTTNSPLIPLPTLSNALFPTTCSTLLLLPPLHHHHHHHTPPPPPPPPPLHFLLQSSLCHPPLLYTFLPWILMHIDPLSSPLAFLPSLSLIHRCCRQ